MTVQITESGRQSIVTKYHGPSNTRGSQVSATAANGARVIISYDDSKRSEEAHAMAARELCNRLKWCGKMVQGGMDNGYVFVFVD